MSGSNQKAFCLLFEEKASKCFHFLDKRINPKVILCAISETVFEKNPIFEFENYSTNFPFFEDFKDTILKKITAQSIPTIMEVTLNGKGPAKKKIHTNELKKNIENAINSDEKSAYHIYCSPSETIKDFLVFTILVLDKEIVDQYYSLKNQPDEYFIITTSLIDATAEQLLDESNLILSTKNPAESVFLKFPNYSEILRKAAFRLMASVEFICNSEHPRFNLYYTLNEISSLKYEGCICKNKMIISKEIGKDFFVDIKLNIPVGLDNHKTIRKLLEIVPENSVMISDSQYVYGWGRFAQEYDPKNEDCFLIRFIRQDVWELSHNGETLMIVDREIPSLPKTEYDKQQFTENINRIISLGDEKVNKLWMLFEIISNQKRGTTLLISKNAVNESKRLEKQSFSLEPFEVTPELMEKITSIDGAVLLDTELRCHGIGVLLDGMASDKCDPSRGSRYNSAIKYTEIQKDCVVIVVSEDGPVDIFPK